MNRLSALRGARAVSLVALVFAFLPTDASASKPNVLLIAVDDLRPELGCYGATHIKSPNIDAFAASGRMFEGAYCQQAVCNPSRTSLMTGMRPDSIGVTGNHTHFRDQHPDVVTLPQHFMRHGYHAAAIGKIYHGVFPEGASITKWDTMGDPESWSVPATRFGPRYYYTEDGIEAAQRSFQQVYKPRDPAADDWTKKLVFGLATEAPDVPDSTLYDGKVADAAVVALRDLQTSDKPFFLAVGFIKPHSPYIAPKKYFDLYDDVSLAVEGSLPNDAPIFAGHRSGELRRYSDQPNSGPFPEGNQKRVRHAYYACVSYIDAQIGRVLEELDQSGLSDETIVVLFGDHGYHLGEQGLWGKTTNFELDARVPLIIRAPQMKAAGRSSSSLVELVDLYPTLAELAGLPVIDQLEGESFASVLEDPERSAGRFALTQYPRSNGLMGFSMRTPTHRLTQWMNRESNRVQATELYDYKDGVVETQNIADSSKQLVATLSPILATAFGVNAEPSDRQEADQESNSAVATRGGNMTSFEQAKPGEFDHLENNLGRWVPVAGKSLVDHKHAKTGKQCLHMTGGEETAITLELKDPVEASSSLTFWAERWTRRAPFSFRIEEETIAGWREIYNGDKEVVVGRAFRSFVTVPLDDKTRNLRFTVTSPPKSGVLIDDIRIAEPKPQKIVSVEAVPFTLPALIGNESCPLLKLKVVTTGQLDRAALSSIRGTLEGTTDPSDIASLSLYVGQSESFSEARPVRSIELERPQKDLFVFSDVDSSCKFAEGTSYLWIAGQLREDADIDHRIAVQGELMGFSDGSTFKLDSGPSIQRMGVAVRNSGDDQAHTYRIPGLATTNSGTLIGVYDVRRRSGGDLPGDIDVGMSRSADGGRTWEPMQVIMDMGDDPEWRYDGIGDPAVLVDRETGTIWVAATWSHGDRSWFGSGQGLRADETGQLMLVRSEDDGLTWSKPINITEQVKHPEWCFVLQGPGKGISMRDGTLVFAAQYQDPPNEKRLPHSTIIYSKDHGRTWHVGAGAFDDTTESQVVEIEPGLLMLNCRYNRDNLRVVMTTRDLGKTWHEHTTSRRALIEPGSCMASLIDVGQEVGAEGNDWLLFSNPDSVRQRHRLTIKASPDNGLTWPKRHRLLLDEGSGRGYSCMSMIDSDTVGILYEGSQAHMTFQRIPLRELHVLGPDLDRTEGIQGKHPPTLSLRLPRVFGDHMVLQSGSEIPIWGSAPSGAVVTVSLGDETQSTTADVGGKWSLRLKQRQANSVPTRMVIETAGQRLTFNDILIGEVWLCAGQSNMEWPLRKSEGGEAELSAADVPNLRLLNLRGGALGSSGSYGAEQLKRLQPSEFFEGEWEVASRDAAADFSAVGWYFGRELQRSLEVPVGLICPAVGGTPTEAWISQDALVSDPKLKGLVAGNWLDNQRLGEFCRQRGEANLLGAIQGGETILADEFGPNHSFKPGFMWSAGIEPLIPYAMRGAIWYQGESNAETLERVQEHSWLLPLLINQWREKWGQGDFPFLYAQLPSLNRPHWPLFREGQRRALAEIRNVGMVVTIDTGHATNVHPTLKRPVGERLARWAIGTTYGANGNASYSGPLPRSATTKGDAMAIAFDHVGEGLKSTDDQPLRLFEIRSEEGPFRPANASLIGHDTVAVSSPEVKEPRYVRYAWRPYAKDRVNLANSAGLPASPFSTEDDPSGRHQTDAETKVNASADSRPNILLIVSEDNGPELGCYGDPYARTPNIDKLAEQGIRFRTAYVTQAVCSPSRGSLLTGLYPHQNGQIGLATHKFQMFRAWPTTYSILKQTGYRTGMLGKLHVNPEDAIEPHIDFRAIKSSNFAKKNLGEYAKKSAEFFNASDRPFFLTVNFPDAHWPVQNRVEGRPSKLLEANDVRPMPYVDFDNPRLRGHVQGYYNCLTRLDECVGELLSVLDASGKADNTLVIYIGDHGAQFARGKVYVTEGGLRIPLIVRWPNRAKPGYVSGQMVSTIDLLPTMVNAAGASIPEGLPGKDLAPVLGGDENPIRRYLFAERNTDAATLHYPQRAVRDDRYKLIKTLMSEKRDPATHHYLINGASNFRGSPTYEELESVGERTQRVYADWLNPPEYQLFDLLNDPHEFVNLAEEPRLADVKARLTRTLEQWQDETGDRLADPSLLAKLTEEVDRCLAEKIRVPPGGWKYVDYLDPQEAK